jgi:hypothetical protein
MLFCIGKAVADRQSVLPVVFSGIGQTAQQNLQDAQHNNDSKRRQSGSVKTI